MNGLDERDEEALVLLKEYALEDDDKLTESALRLKRMLLAIAGKTTTKCKEEMEGLRAWAKLLQGIATEQHVKECADFVYMTADQALANCKRPYGDMAEIRSALEKVRDAHYVKEDNNGDQYEGFNVEADDGTGRPLIVVVESALEKKPRNCDRFGGDKDRLHDEWWDWSGNLKNCNPDGTVKMTFGEWLLAEVEE